VDSVWRNPRRWLLSQQQHSDWLVSYHSSVHTVEPMTSFYDFLLLYHQSSLQSVSDIPSFCFYRVPAIPNYSISKLLFDAS